MRASHTHSLSLAHRQALQLNLYRHILESEYGMVVSGLFLGIAHPLRSGPLCLEVPRMEAEIGLVIEHEDATKNCACPQLSSLKSCQAFRPSSSVSQRRRT